MTSSTFDAPSIAHKPEEWPRLFEFHLNAGEVEKVVALYEPGACFVADTGETLFGRDRIREVLARLIEQKTQLSSQVRQVVALEDVAVLYTNFDGTTVDGSGHLVDFMSRAIEVLRRQQDGSWKLIIGDPNGRK
jgi:uncharacterized protein (TIGR02246 family)